MNTSTTTTKTKPVHSIGCGLLRAAIWANQTENGLFYNTTFERRFRDDKGEWQSTSGFSRDDLLVLGKLADIAHTWICAAQDAARNQSRRSGNGQDDPSGGAHPSADSSEEGHAAPHAGRGPERSRGESR